MKRFRSFLNEVQYGPLLATLITIGVCWWCARPHPAVYPHGVPNLDVVGPGVWRSGQPQTPESWAYLRSLGVTRVVKLNYDEEAADDGAAAAGITVIALPIPPKGDLRTLLERPDRRTVHWAVDQLNKGGGVLVHCTHGQDRTGLVVAIYRVVHDGETKALARREMLAHGYHPELIALDDFWEDFDPKDW